MYNACEYGYLGNSSHIAIQSGLRKCLGLAATGTMQFMTQSRRIWREDIFLQEHSFIINIVEIKFAYRLECHKH